MFTHRLAAPADLEALRAVMALAIAELQKGFLSPERIAASNAVMGLDTQLIADGTYFIVEEDGRIAGCGGWSHRATLYGGDHSKDLRDPAPLDPAVDAARIRAMYTHPDFARRGVGLAPVTLAHNCPTPAGVDEVLDRARAAGADVSTATRREWGGYSGYFADPAGFRWEVAYNPGDIGRLVVTDTH